MHVLWLSILLSVFDLLTHWGRGTHKCGSKLTIIGSENSLVGVKPSSEPILEYCWLDPFSYKFQWSLNRNLYILIQWNAFENVAWKMAAILSRTIAVIGISLYDKPHWSPSKSILQIWFSNTFTEKEYIDGLVQDNCNAWDNVHRSVLCCFCVKYLQRRYLIASFNILHKQRNVYLWYLSVQK